MFVFDGGTTRAGAQAFQLPPAELRSARFIEADALGVYVVPRLERRILAAIEVDDDGLTSYLEH